MPTINQSVSNTLTLSQSAATQNNLNLSLLHNLFFVQNCNGDQTLFLDAYGTLSEANTYFDNRLRSVSWKRARKEDKMSALREATLIIDRLNYSGDKSDPTQYHQFPRQPTVLPTQVVIDPADGLPVNLKTLQDDPDTRIPRDIKYACFEVAIKLIQGYDPDKEVDLLATESHSYSGVRTSFNREFVPDYIRAGIPSFRAWTYLRPYLRNPEEIVLTRVG